MIEYKNIYDTPMIVYNRINAYLTMYAQMPNNGNSIAKNIELAMEFVSKDNKQEAINWLQNVWRSIWAAQNHINFKEYAYALLTIPKATLLDFEGSLEEIIEAKVQENRKNDISIEEISTRLDFFFKEN